MGKLEKSRPIFCNYYGCSTPAPNWELCFYHKCGTPELFDLENDPLEPNNRFNAPDVSAIKNRLIELATENWNGVELFEEIKENQRQRKLIVGVELLEEMNRHN